MEGSTRKHVELSTKRLSPAFSTFLPYYRMEAIIWASILSTPLPWNQKRPTNQQIFCRMNEQGCGHDWFAIFAISSTLLLYKHKMKLKLVLKPPQSNAKAMSQEEKPKKVKKWGKVDDAKLQQLL